MKYKITMDEVEEMIICILHCGLSDEEALEYAKEFMDEVHENTETEEEL